MTCLTSFASYKYQVNGVIEHKCLLGIAHINTGISFSFERFTNYIVCSSSQHAAHRTPLGKSQQTQAQEDPVVRRIQLQMIHGHHQAMVSLCAQQLYTDICPHPPIFLCSGALMCKLICKNTHVCLFVNVIVFNRES